MKGLENNWNTVNRIVVLGLLLSPPLFASLDDAEQAEEKARKAFVEHFSTFVQDKNVMGRALTPDGKPLADPGPNKTQFNRDDGASYRGDLTFHDKAYKSPDAAYQKKQSEKKSQDTNNEPLSRTLLPHTSHHGGLSEAGGSSILERVDYALHEKFSTKEENETDEERKKKEEEKGVKFESKFKIETREVFKKDIEPPKSAPQPPPTSQSNEETKKEEEPEKVERVTIREEALSEIEKVGEGSFDSIDRAAKDKGFENDPQTLSNSTFLREAAGRATEAWRNSTLANLIQRRVNRGITPGGDGGDRPELNEDTPTCEAWAEEALQEKLRVTAQRTGGRPIDPKALETLQKQTQEAKLKCDELSKLSYKAIDPKFRKKEGGKGEELVQGELLKEDQYSRDNRNQLVVIDKAGIDVSKLQSNWKYDPKEEKQNVTISFDEKGTPSQQANWTVRELFDSYNEQLDGAGEGFKAVKERFPQLQYNEEELGQFKLKPEEKSTVQINKMTPQMYEDLGVSAESEQQESEQPDNYIQLLEKSKGPASR